MNQNERNRRGQENRDEIVIDLMPIWKALKKRIALLVTVTLICGVLAGLASMFLITPTYRTNFRVYVNNSQDTSEKKSVSSSDLSAARSLATTYAEIMKGRTVLQEAAKRAGVDVSYKKLSKMVQIETNSATEIITASVTAESPQTAKTLAEHLANVAQNQVANIVDGSSMRVIDEPYLPLTKNAPNNSKNAVIGAFLGLMLSTLCVVLCAVLDNRVGSEESLEERYGIAVLGSIPDYNEARRAGNNSYGKASK